MKKALIIFITCICIGLSVSSHVPTHHGILFTNLPQISLLQIFAPLLYAQTF